MKNVSRQISKLHPAQVKMLLDALGIPLKEQPSKLQELKPMLQIFKDKDNEKFQHLYSLVVDHEVPDGIEQTVVPLEHASKIVNDEITERVDSVFKNIDTKFHSEATRLLEGVQERLSSAIEIESKKYNKIEHVVKIGKSNEKKIDGILPEYFGTLVQLAKMRKNILLVGPAGAGKTFIAAKLAEALELKYASQSCSAGVSESAFTGRLLPLGDHGRFEYVQSDFVTMYEEGGVFLFDEFDAADPNVLVFLNQALANDHFYCPQRTGNTLVKKHKDFVAVAAANTFGSGGDIMYSARNSLDAATLDRFRIGTIEVNYSEHVEQSLIDPEILKWGMSVRNSILSHKLQKIMSTRFLKDATDMKCGVDWSLEQIAEMYFSDWSKEELAVVGIYDKENLVSNFV